MVCLMGVYVHSPSLISRALHRPCTQQQGILAVLQGHLPAGLGAEAGWNLAGGQGMRVLLKAEG